MIRWKYKVISTKTPHGDDYLTAFYGCEGWELCNICVVNEKLYYTFKRPLQKDETIHE